MRDFGKKQQTIQQFLTEILRLESGLYSRSRARVALGRELQLPMSFPWPIFPGLDQDLFPPPWFSSFFGIRFQSGAKECIVQISARAFQRVFTCKIWLRYSPPVPSVFEDSPVYQPCTRSSFLTSETVLPIRLSIFVPPHCITKQFLSQGYHPLCCHSDSLFCCSDSLIATIHECHKLLFDFAGFPLETRRLPFPFVFGC